jgi:hypothetical protein
MKACGQLHASAIPTPSITHELGICVGPYRSIKYYIRPPTSLHKFLLSFGSEYSVFQFVVQKYKD